MGKRDYNKDYASQDMETIFARIVAGISPRMLGRGEILSVIVHNPLINADGTENNSTVWVGSASNMIYDMIPGQDSPIFYAEDLKDLYIKLQFPFPNPNGAILTLSTSAAVGGKGTGYEIGDVLSLPHPDGIGTIATVTVTLVDKGEILTFGAGGAGGAGYVIGDIVDIDNGTQTAQVLIQNVGGAGEVTAFALTPVGDGGLGYSVGIETTTGGSGAGFTVEIATVSAGPGSVLAFTLTTPGLSYTDADVIAATGGSGEGAIFVIDTVQTEVAETADIALIICRLREGGLQ